MGNSVKDTFPKDLFMKVFQSGSKSIGNETHDVFGMRKLPLPFGKSPAESDSPASDDFSKGTGEKSRG